ncbi:MAG TPA: AMP-binding protein [Solirubrobacteraceae bacterium]|jgi:crotonobetaine/carnitine-CoA ligase
MAVPGVLPHFPSRSECVIADLLAAQASERPEHPFVVFPDETWTFAQAASRAWELAAGLISEQVQPGECVSVWCPTRPELVQTWFAINAAGAIYAPVNLAARGAFLEHALNLAKPRVLIAHEGLIERLQGLDVPSLELVVSIGGAPEVEVPWRLIEYEQLLAPAGTPRPALETPTEPWDDFALVYTSGTTGPSKGVRLSYASHRLYADSLVWPEIGADDRFMVSVPLSHVGGTSLSYAMLQRGGTVVLPGGFNAREFWRDVRRYEATATFVIHGMVSFLLGQPPSDDDTDNPLRFVYMGPLTRVQEFADRFGVKIWTGFGMTELPTSLRSGLNPTHETTVGRPFNPDFECRLVDEHDLPVPDGTPGELIVRHKLPWVINSGYKDMPEATASAWRNGWFHTGDQMLVDEQGEWVFVDRAKDAIRRRGENISSYEVEAEVLSHPDVDQVAAIAVPTPEMEESAGDEEVKVVIVAVQGRTIDPMALSEYLVPRMPRHMVPRFIEIVDELPRTPSFKVKKADLRAAGITPATWDREKAGLRLRGEKLS